MSCVVLGSGRLCYATSTSMANVSTLHMIEAINGLCSFTANKWRIPSLSCAPRFCNTCCCRFWWFLFIQGILITWALTDAVSAWNLHPDFKEGLIPGFSILLASILLCLTFLFDWGLFLYHSFLLATARTTAEHVYRRNGPVAYLQHVPKKVSAFSQGLCRNVYLACCAPGPALYHLPPREQLLEVAQQETVWDNRYYSCCR